MRKTIPTFLPGLLQGGAREDAQTAPRPEDHPHAIGRLPEKAVTSGRWRNTIRAMLGHISPDTTNVYAEVDMGCVTVDLATGQEQGQSDGIRDRRHD